MSDPASLEISLADGSLRISGSETFISVQMKELAPIVDQLFATYTGKAAKVAAVPLPSDGSNGPSSQTDGLDAYPNVFAHEADQLKVLKAMTGGSVAEKAKTLAHIYLFGKHLLGQEPTKSDELREAMREHSCLDSSNFSKWMKADKENIIVTQPGPKTLFFKLSVPGRERAKAVVASLNS